MPLLGGERVVDRGEEPRSSYASDVLMGVNMARMQDSAVICVSEGVTCSVPIQILFLSISSSRSLSPSISYPSLALALSKDSSLTLKQSYASLSVTPEYEEKEEIQEEREREREAESLSVGNTQVSVGIGAKLKHTFTQEISDNSMSIDVISADVAADASYDLISLQSGAFVSKLNVHVNLTAIGANCSVTGVSIAKERQSQDIHTSIQHLDRATNSEQLQRNVVGNKGEAIFKGRIRMPPIAQKADSSQLCRSLLLGSSARLQAMPVLEIAADDVSCSHGAAIADLDENAMFYLASRGVDRREARKLLLGSFALELLDNAVMDKRALSRVRHSLDAMNASADNKEEEGETEREKGGSMGYTSM
mmetsp:Transcript_1257/g.1320  ORF Transcript_1257/g.1320 Transcript_1257/m.1320 type:complete len:364 (+) Transcript_1257:575-1666(+)